MKLFCVILLTCASTSMFAQVWVAVAPGPKNWEDGFNWSTGAPPLATEPAIFDGTSNIACQLNGDVTVARMVVSGFTGSINLKAHNLNIQAGGNNSFTSGSIGSTLGTGNLTFNTTGAVTFNGTSTGAGVNLVATLTTATGVFTGGALTTFGGPVTVTAHSILLNGSTYSSTASFTMSSTATPANSISNGGNVFHGLTTISNEMNATFRMAAAAGDTFNGELRLSLDGTNQNCKIEMSYGLGTTTSYNNNIRVRTDNTPGLSSVILGNVANNAWISFGQPVLPAAPPAGGLSTLASGFTITELGGSNSFDQDRTTKPNDFHYGDLILNNFTQLGNTAQSINLRIPNVPSSEASVTTLRFLIRNSTFNGNVTFSASNPYISGSTFKGSVNTLTKTVGSGSDTFDPPPSFLFTWDGGNTFENTTLIDNRGRATMVLGGTTGDVFTGNVTFNSQQDASSFMIAHTGTTYFLGNVAFTQAASGANIRLGFGGGTASFEGTSTQTLSSQTSIPSFGNVTMKNSNGLTLNTPIVISGALDLNSGIITSSSSSNYVSFTASASASNAKDASFIDGPVRKTGKAAFTFPIGDGGFYHPLAMTAPSDIAAEFAARYLAVDHGLGVSRDVTLQKVSDCEHWTLDRLVGSDNPTVTLYWNSPYCRLNYITNASFLRVARWSGTQWDNLGAAAFNDVPAADGTNGYLLAASALPNVASHSLTLGSIDAVNILPINLSSFSVIQVETSAEVSWTTATEHNNDYFTIERLVGNDFIALATIDGAGTSNSPRNYRWLDTEPLPGRSYYRLKQTDFDGSESFSEVVMLDRQTAAAPYPNPVTNTLFLDGISLSEDSKVIIRDVTGRTIYSAPASATIDFSNLVPGVYQVGIAANSAVTWFRVRKK
ncbi:MAG TPA: T9SS type A sorting domain-containing protein [Chryseosolibacter sp.]